MTRGDDRRFDFPAAPWSERRRGQWGGVLREPGVVPLLQATFLARLSGRMFTLAIVLDSLQRYHTPNMAGWVLFAAAAPGLLASPLAGALLDRIGATLAITLDMLASAALVAGLSLGGDGDPAILLTLTAFYSLTSPLSAAGIRSLLPRLVPAQVLDRVNALDTGIHALTEVVGPALAGTLFALLGAHFTLAVIAALALLSAASLLRLRSPATDQDGAPRGSLWREAGAGLAIVLRHPTLRGLVVLYTLYQVSWGVLLVAIPVLVRLAAPVTARADSITGLIWAASGLAGGAGALLAGHLRVLGRERAFISLGALVSAAAVLSGAATAGLAGLAVGVTLFGFCSGPIDVGLLTLRQRRTEPRQLARVLAVSMSLNMAGLPIGSALGGILLTHGANAALLTAAVAAALAAVACQSLLPAER
jgi:predicted MFS family arabinose efflux permease